MVLTTSNITGAIDVAFVDRADIKAYIGPPGLLARYGILRSCVLELIEKGARAGASGASVGSALLSAFFSRAWAISMSRCGPLSGRVIDSIPASQPPQRPSSLAEPPPCFVRRRRPRLPGGRPGRRVESRERAQLPAAAVPGQGSGPAGDDGGPRGDARCGERAPVPLGKKRRWFNCLRFCSWRELRRPTGGGVAGRALPVSAGKAAAATKALWEAAAAAEGLSGAGKVPPCPSLPVNKLEAEAGRASPHAQMLRNSPPLTHLRVPRPQAARSARLRSWRTRRFARRGPPPARAGCRCCASFRRGAAGRALGARCGSRCPTAREDGAVCWSARGRPTRLALLSPNDACCSCRLDSPRRLWWRPSGRRRATER